MVREEHAVEIIKEAVRAIRNVRTSMNVPPSKKAKVFVVSEDQEVREIFEHSKVFFATLGYASEVAIQADKNGIAEDAVSAVDPQGGHLYAVCRAGGHREGSRASEKRGGAPGKGACPGKRNVK